MIFLNQMKSKNESILKFMLSYHFVGIFLFIMYYLSLDFNMCVQLVDKHLHHYKKAYMLGVAI